MAQTFPSGPGRSLALLNPGMRLRISTRPHSLDSGGLRNESRFRISARGSRGVNGSGGSRSDRRGISGAIGARWIPIRFLRIDLRAKNPGNHAVSVPFRVFPSFSPPLRGMSGALIGRLNPSRSPAGCPAVKISAVALRGPGGTLRAAARLRTPALCTRSVRLVAKTQNPHEY
ncbi:MAG: hypothetical protein KAR13_21435 [Desulfobulbaceae bacterium]|nr:hypothetical protein [Desulfobulbaceae bacterium]